jgi:hypothetical protein
MYTQLLLIALFFSSISSDVNTNANIQGAWRSSEGVVILAENYFAYTIFTSTGFVHAYGGSWKIEGDNLVLSYEFNTENPEKVGTTANMNIQFEGNSMVVDDLAFSRIDDGTPGKLAGTWLFSNRMRNGELGKPRSADNPRKTMKILSGTRFQWIAYNVESKEFMGSGGGTYTTIDGKYTENIDFFSRDNSRVGASLEFDFERKDDEWHHRGLSSKGDPIHEIWSLRE